MRCPMPTTKVVVLPLTTYAKQTNLVNVQSWYRDGLSMTFFSLLYAALSRSPAFSFYYCECPQPGSSAMVSEIVSRGNLRQLHDAVQECFRVPSMTHVFASGKNVNNDRARMRTGVLLHASWASSCCGLCLGSDHWASRRSDHPATCEMRFVSANCVAGLLQSHCRWMSGRSPVRAYR
ncbi:hypothetical protein HBI56_111880 [Parastagonospora nodorum]|nr:hypothetical protein HBH47_024650 [Parastagonospora nodorum]KAH4268090.1 hypothetical protein HBI03_059160 [Parastagonospora nodorum]KAH4279145.1 hypothetical protein HBI04_074610 [Parastagonospora nodorum]KAH5082482.1 hypothetical protein HBH95_055640 [Parastagonospora nodorum]KAH5312732.1 hypothetical protein HBI11_088510 [Parastagonospora nodorum]